MCSSNHLLLVNRLKPWKLFKNKVLLSIWDPLLVFTLFTLTLSTLALKVFVLKLVLVILFSYKRAICTSIWGRGMTSGSSLLLKKLVDLSFSFFFFFELAGGVVMFTKSLVPYKRKGIRINVLCPEVRLQIKYH